MAIVSTNSERLTETTHLKERYSDFLIDLDPHPNTLDIVRTTNDNAVKRSIRNLLQTDRYERLMQPKIGSHIRKMLFEPMSDITAEQIRKYCVETIGNFEPRARVIDVNIEMDEPNLTYRVYVFFFVINNPDPQSMQINLYRVR